MASSSATLLKSYDPKVSKRLKVLFRQLPRLEEPFKFFKHIYYAYQLWLDSISNILSVESPSEDLFDRMEWALSSYLFAANAAIDHLKNHYESSGLGKSLIDSRVALCKKVSKEFAFGQALRHYVTHTATPISRRTSSVNLSKRHVGIIFNKVDAEKDDKKRNHQAWKNVLPLLPEKIDLPDYLKDHYTVTMNSIGGYFYLVDVLPSVKELLELLDLPPDVDKSDSVLLLIEKTLQGDQAGPSRNVGLIANCSGLLREFEFLLSVFVLPKSALVSSP
jgi:hypothetical protein